MTFPAPDSVRFGVYASQTAIALGEYIRLWTDAESLGFDCLYTFDHLRPPAAPQGEGCFEATILLSALAAATKTSRIGSLVWSPAYRHPAVLASIATTLDHASGGRLEIGLGAGGDDLSFGEYGMDFPPVRDRMDRLAETCAVLSSLLSQESTDFEGEYFTLRQARLYPKPLQDRVPIIIGGSGRHRLLRIAARHADIWNTFASDPADYEAKLALLDRFCAECGREGASVRKSIVFRFRGSADECMTTLAPYHRAGVRDFILALRSPFDEAALGVVAQVVAPSLRAGV